MRSSEKRRGSYLGTEIDEKWWRRYRRDGLLARGIGEFWIESSSLSFRRNLTDLPIVIPFVDMLDVKVGKWHSGKWAGGALVVKIIWNKIGNRLSSGFVFSRDLRETETLVREILYHMRKAENYKQQR